MITIEGQKLKCRICGKDVNVDSGIVFSGLYEYNENKPLSVFNDSIIHESCLMCHPLKNELYYRIDILDKLSKENVRDYITGERLDVDNIGHPDNLIRFIYFTDDESSVLYKYNCIFINKNNLTKWKEFPKVLLLLQELNDSLEWKGNAIQSLINQLQSPLKEAWSKEFLEKMRSKYNK